MVTSGFSDDEDEDEEEDDKETSFEENERKRIAQKRERRMQTFTKPNDTGSLSKPGHGMSFNASKISPLPCQS